MRCWYPQSYRLSNALHPWCSHLHMNLNGDDSTCISVKSSLTAFSQKSKLQPLWPNITHLCPSSTVTCIRQTLINSALINNVSYPQPLSPVSQATPTLPLPCLSFLMVWPHASPLAFCPTWALNTVFTHSSYFSKSGKMQFQGILYAHGIFMGETSSTYYIFQRLLFHI